MKNRIIYPIGIFAVGFAASVAVWSMLSNREERLIRSEFEMVAQERADAIQREFHEDVELLHSIAAFYAGSQFVDDEEFRIFTTPLIDRHKSVLALEWLPLVTRANREQFERQFRDRGHREFVVRELGPEGNRVEAGRRDTYFPVLNSTQAAYSAASPFGFDHASDPVRWRAMQQARDTGDAVASQRITLFRVAGARERLDGVLVAMPIYANGLPRSTVQQRRENLTGFAVGLFRFSDVVNRAISAERSADVDFRIRDEDAEPSRQLLFAQAAQQDLSVRGSHESDLVSKKDWWHRTTMAMSGRNWTIDSRPAAEFVSSKHTMVPLASMLCGIIVCGLLAAHVHLILGRAETVEGQVIQRTAELQQAEERLRLIIASAPNGIVMIDEAGSIKLANPKVEEMFGYSRDELHGQQVEILVPKDLQQRHTELRDQFIKSPAVRPMGNSRDLFGMRKDGTEFPVELGLNPLRTDEGVFVLGAVVDITERKKTELALKEYAAQLETFNHDLRLTKAELERKNQELDEFTYVASHDLQEPVRKLISFSKLLEEDMGADLNEQAAKDLEFIVDAASRMRDLVQALLALSRAGRAAMKQERVSLEYCASQAIDALQLRVRETGAEIVRDPLPDVIGDETVLTQLYQNLISNALKFMDDGQPTIHLTAERDGRQWILGVKDNGIGMKADYFERIFQPFQRLHNRGEYPGTGIGLSICKKTVNRHGGQIWVESVPGQGSHFRFTLQAIAKDTLCIPTSEIAANALLSC